MNCGALNIARSFRICSRETLVFSDQHSVCFVVELLFAGLGQVQLNCISRMDIRNFQTTIVFFVEISSDSGRLVQIVSPPISALPYPGVDNSAILGNRWLLTPWSFLLWFTATINHSRRGKNGNIVNRKLFYVQNNKPILRAKFFFIDTNELIPVKLSPKHFPKCPRTMSCFQKSIAMRRSETEEASLRRYKHPMVYEMSMRCRALL